MNVITVPAIPPVDERLLVLTPSAIIFVRIDVLRNLMTPDGSGYATNDSTYSCSDTRHYGANRSSGRSAT